MNLSAKPKLFIRGPGGLDSQNKKVSKNLVTLLLSVLLLQKLLMLVLMLLVMQTWVFNANAFADGIVAMV